VKLFIVQRHYVASQVNFLVLRTCSEICRSCVRYIHFNFHVLYSKFRISFL